RSKDSAITRSSGATARRGEQTEAVRVMQALGSHQVHRSLYLQTKAEKEQRGQNNSNRVQIQNLKSLMQIWFEWIAIIVAAHRTKRG
ncbi:MAG TPA: hypothetical protein PK746_10065, partial [Spirochaetales bacterium]|nr:hypothetical protein [Spirochaetales bacterium]